MEDTVGIYHRHKCWVSYASINILLSAMTISLYQTPPKPFSASLVQIDYSRWIHASPDLITEQFDYNQIR